MGKPNPIQEEFCMLLKKANWRPADAARALDLSESIVSYYVNGKSDPPARTMELLRRIIREKEETKSGYMGVIGAFKAKNRSDALSAIQQIEEGVSSLKEILGRPIGIMPIAARKETVNSAEADLAGLLAGEGVKTVLNERPGLPPSCAVDVPSVQTYRPKRGSARRSNVRPASPGPAPTAPKDE